jgi:hypothetical protein
LQRIAALPISSLRRRGVDGRDKPGHDDKGSKGQSKKTEQQQTRKRCPLPSSKADFRAELRLQMHFMHNGLSRSTLPFVPMRHYVAAQQAG